MNDVQPIHIFRRQKHPEQRPGLSLTIDGTAVQAATGQTLLAAATAAGIYIPALCLHPDLPQDCVTDGEGGCGLCLVEITDVQGVSRQAYACRTRVAADMQVLTRSPAIDSQRQQALARTLTHHPHVCLTCPQREGCSRVTCSYGHPVAARCCDIFNHCELRKVADHVVIPPDVPVYDLDAACNRLPMVKDGPFYDLDYNLCIDCRRCLVACNEVRGVGCLEVKQTAGRSWVGPIADTLMESECKFCNACIEVCPTGALIDRTQTAEQRQRNEAPCTTACPADIDVPRYVQLAALGHFAQANAVVREKLPFPAMLGRACHAPCESACRRAELDQPISIRSLKRMANEHDDGQWRALQWCLAESGKSVAVVGAGLAGLTTAFYLAKQGHAVTVFEALPAAGGMARFAIPAYRLPRELVAQEVAELTALGVSFCFATRIGNPAALLAAQNGAGEQTALAKAGRAAGFDAVYIAIGAQRGARLNIPGDDLPGVVDGLSFLREVALGNITALAGRIAVIGGGDSACDAARSAWRLGADAVELVYRRRQLDMPALASEVAASLREGVVGRFETLPVAFASVEGGVQVRWRISQGQGSRETLATYDQVIVAIGQQSERLAELPHDGAGRLQTLDAAVTDHPGLFAGGDAVTGPKSLIDAVAQGRLAASRIDRHLGGRGDIDEVLLDENWRDWHSDSWIAREEGFNQRRLVAAPVLTGQRNWQEVEQAYAPQDASAEALRCLKCNLMHSMQDAMLPPVRQQRLNAEQLLSVPAAAGVYFILDAGDQILAIKGADNLQTALTDVLDQLAGDDDEASSLSFRFEEAHFYSQRENELLQAYSEQHGRLPPGVGEDDLDDLF